MLAINVPSPAGPAGEGCFGKKSSSGARRKLHTNMIAPVALWVTPPAVLAYSRHTGIQRRNHRCHPDRRIVGGCRPNSWVGETARLAFNLPGDALPRVAPSGTLGGAARWGA